MLDQDEYATYCQTTQGELFLDYCPKLPSSGQGMSDKFETHTPFLLLALRCRNDLVC